MSKSLNRVRLRPLIHFFAIFFKIHDKQERNSKIRSQRARKNDSDALNYKASGPFFLVMENLILEENEAKTALL